MSEKEQILPTIDQIKLCIKALEDKKAIDLKIIHMGEKSSITDYFIIATGNSEPHLKALAGSVELTMKQNGIEIFGRNLDHTSGWVVVDAYDFMVHIFLPSMRDLYRLESLWKDAENLTLESLGEAVKI